MRTMRVHVAIAAIALGMALGAPVRADDTSMMNEDELALHQVEDQVIALQGELAAARMNGGDEKKVAEMQKKFDKLQKRRVELLRKTWQM